MGTGQTEAVNLTKVNMNDCMLQASTYHTGSANLNLGGTRCELFDDVNFTDMVTSFSSGNGPG